MLGKRPRPTMRRTSSVSLIGAGSVNGDSSPLPEHPKEKLKSSNCASPSACAPRQVIGFHPKAYIAEELELTAPISPRRVPQSAKSPGGSPRSGLVDLLGRAPWGRKDEGGVVGLGIVAALSGSQEEAGIIRDDNRQYCGVPPAFNGWRTPGQSHHHSPSPFAPPRASPPIPILNPGGSAFTPDRVTYIQNHPPAYDNPLCHSLKPDSVRPESLFAPDNGLGSQQRGGGGSRPNSTLSTTVTWAKPSSVVTSGITTLLWQQQQNHHAHVDVEMEPQSPQVFHLRHHFAPVAPPPISPGGYSHSFLEECHLCKRHLVGNDIYIYRGDRAFCSPECRLQQITIDERREKCSSAVLKMGTAVDPRSATQRTRVAGTAAAA